MGREWSSAKQGALPANGGGRNNRFADLPWKTLGRL